jgi:hypothetical protein
VDLLEKKDPTDYLYKFLKEYAVSLERVLFTEISNQPTSYSIMDRQRLLILDTAR